MGSDAIANSFELLGLSDNLLKAVSDAGYTQPTPIQRQAIPSVLQGRDVLGIAQTGTGKTASFTLPMIDVLAEGRTKARMPRSLILEPTRELAAQVADNFETYGRNHKLNMALLIGGVSFADQEAKLERGVDVLIATPGRLLDHFERGKLMLNGVQILVVDEADRMMDMGFIPDVERIFKLMPQKHQTLFFSATMPKTIKRLTDQFLTDPKTIEVAPPASAAETVTQRLVTVTQRNKLKALKAALAEEGVSTAIVFCNRKRDIGTVAKGLKREGHAVGELHGDMSQPERMETLQSLKDDKISILVASDVAARGLDIAAVSHVINFDVPNNTDDYVHRIGRTGRAGRSGVALTIASPEDAKYVDDIRKALGVSLDSIKLEGVPAARAKAEPGDDAARAEPGDDEARTEPDENTPHEERGQAGEKRGNRSRRRKSKNSETAEKTTTPDPGKTEQPAVDEAAPAPTKSAGERRSRGGKGGRGRSDKGGGREEQVVGLGDHVPAFLLRPVPKRSKSLAEGEGEGSGSDPSDEADDQAAQKPQAKAASKSKKNGARKSAKSEDNDGENRSKGGNAGARKSRSRQKTGAKKQENTAENGDASSPEEPAPPVPADNADEGGKAEEEDNTLS